MSTEGQGHLFTINFPDLYVLCFTRSRYQVSVYRFVFFWRGGGGGGGGAVKNDFPTP